jgi:hypothetical protein
MSAGSSVQSVPNQGPNPNLPAAFISGGLKQVFNNWATPYSLINGGQNIFTPIAVPNDGVGHPFVIGGSVSNTGGAVTGGILTLGYVVNGQAVSTQIAPGGYATGTTSISPVSFVADPGTTVSVSQSAATAGTAKVYITVSSQ